MHHPLISLCLEERSCREAAGVPPHPSLKPALLKQLLMLMCHTGATYSPPFWKMHPLHLAVLISTLSRPTTGKAFAYWLVYQCPYTAAYTSSTSSSIWLLHPIWARRPRPRRTRSSPRAAPGSWWHSNCHRRGVALVASRRWWGGKTLGQSEARRLTRCGGKCQTPPRQSGVGPRHRH